MEHYGRASINIFSPLTPLKTHCVRLSESPIIPIKIEEFGLQDFDFLDDSPAKDYPQIFKYSKNSNTTHRSN